MICENANSLPAVLNNLHGALEEFSEACAAADWRLAHDLLGDIRAAFVYVDDTEIPFATAQRYVAGCFANGIRSRTDLANRLK